MGFSHSVLLVSRRSCAIMGSHVDTKVILYVVDYKQWRWASVGSI
jgi:hypothetical protein